MIQHPHATMRRTLTVTALAPLVWGTSYLTATELLPADRPLLTATLRALPAGLVLIALGRTLPSGRWWWRAGVLGVLNIGAFFALMFIAAGRLPGGVAATLGAVHPLIVTVLAGVVLHERVPPAVRLAMPVGLAGVAALVLTPDARLDALGILAGLAGAASTAAGVILTKRWGRPVGLVAFTGWQLVAGGAALLPLLLALEGLPAGLTAVNLAGYAWLVIPGTVGAYLVWFRGVLALPASRVSVLTFLTPLTAAALGFRVLGEGLTVVQMGGVGAILTAVTATAIAGRARPVAQVEQRHATVR